MKPKSRTTLRKKLWKLFSEYVRRKEKGKCYTCGKVDDWKNMDCGHYEHSDNLDYNEKNCHCQCVSCNRYRHGNLTIYAIHLEKDYGHGILEELHHIKNQTKYWGIKELETLIEEYKIKLKQL